MNTTKCPTPPTMTPTPPPMSPLVVHAHDNTSPLTTPIPRQLLHHRPPANSTSSNHS
ncbi:hypothetical protein ACHAWU_005110 [Discostella pseudostelligera]|uniref:Uncharacterized protein n=1 Tax=Discostella pseudostelligera TaxID=259834 RepID=A0ABD3M1Y9_9STRA